MNSSSSQVATYLHEIAQNQRKLQYCRQILASNTQFTPQTVLNIKSSQNSNTISRRQFIQIIKIILDNKQSQLQLVFSYFQVDGKNYITLEEFSNLILPNTNISLKNVVINRRVGSHSLDYSLKYSLQKFFTQIIENQNRLEQYCKINLNKKQNGKMKHRKIDLQNIKVFLGLHGKFPNESALEIILKEIMMNKGADKQNKLICEYILDFNQMNSTSHKLQNTAKQLPSCQIKQNSDNNQFKGKNNQFSRINLPLSDKSLQDVSKGFHSRLNINEGDNKITKPLNNQVDQRIKTLMDSIKIKSHDQISQSKISVSSSIRVNTNLFEQKENTKIVELTKREQNNSKDFSQIQIYSRRQTKNDLCLNQKSGDKRKVYKASKLCSQNGENKDRYAVNPNRTITFSDQSKETAKPAIPNRKGDNTTRLQYLKSLVAQNPKDQTSKHISTYRL